MEGSTELAGLTYFGNAAGSGLGSGGVLRWKPGSASNGQLMFRDLGLGRQLDFGIPMGGLVGGRGSKTKVARVASTEAWSPRQIAGGDDLNALSFRPIVLAAKRPVVGIACG
jgi:hypothetical protein